MFFCRGEEAEENGSGKSSNTGMACGQGLEELEKVTSWENKVKYSRTTSRNLRSSHKLTELFHRKCKNCVPGSGGCKQAFYRASSKVAVFGLSWAGVEQSPSKASQLCSQCRGDTVGGAGGHGARTPLPSPARADVKCWLNDCRNSA